MYYCSACGVVNFLNRAENKNKPGSKPAIEMNCNVCNKITNYRRLVPEDLHAANMIEVDQEMRDLYKEILKLKPDKE